MKKYIKPESNLVLFQTEGIIAASDPQIGDHTPSTGDNDNNIFSTGKGAWSSENWTEE